MRNAMKSHFDKACQNNRIDSSLYRTYSVKMGLRNEDGTGVLVGLTRISDVVGYRRQNHQKIDTQGKLYYRGIDIEDLIVEKDFLFERTCFLILFGYLPNNKDLKLFHEYLSNRYKLPYHFLEDHILGSPSKNLMNKLQQVVLMLYEYDKDPDNGDAYETLMKGIDLIAKLPFLMCYTYSTKLHYYSHESLVIHHRNKDYGIAGTILSLLRPDGKFSRMEENALDIALVLHADHGGGNNSTFTNVVISSTGTDLYSSIAGAIGSLKGPRHGGANLAVKKQMELAIQEIGVDASDEDINLIVNRILDKDFHDRSGLIYGIGHAVYTLSDPRSVILERKCYELSIEKHREKEFSFYQRFARISVQEIFRRKNKHVCSNVDFYSGLLYDMLEIPSDIYTLLFVCSRVVGWVGHNVENKLYANKIIRPATQYVGMK